ncbi:MAG: hypothetical protein ACR2HR_13720 [Euzebya sp.]
MFVTLGFLAGSSWRTVERIAGRASLLLLVLVVMVVAIRWATSRLARRADDIAALTHCIAELPIIMRITGRYRRQLDWARAQSSSWLPRLPMWSARATRSEHRRDTPIAL